MTSKTKTSWSFTISKEELPWILSMEKDIKKYEANPKNYIINEDGEKEYWCGGHTPMVTIEGEDYLSIRYTYDKDGQIWFIATKINNENENKRTFVIKGDKQ